MTQLFRHRPGVVGAALLLGGLLLAAPEVSWAGERCTTKPMVCARLKAERAQQGRAPSGALATRAALPGAPQTQPAALTAEARCRLKPGVCSRLRNEVVARGGDAPVQVAAYSTGTERCTTKPMVCARLKARPGQPALTLASEPGPSAID